MSHVVDLYPRLKAARLRVRHALQDQQSALEALRKADAEVVAAKAALHTLERETYKRKG